LCGFQRSDNPIGLVRFYHNPYALRRIERVSIPSKSKSLSLHINPPNLYGLKITEQVLTEDFFLRQTLQKRTVFTWKKRSNN
jgi:hypothetical protein